MNILWVGAGGFIGAVTRYLLSGFVLHRTAESKFPVATFIVNVSGCLVAGLLAGLAEKHDMFGGNVRLFLFTGILGGYTTFSAFGLETFYLIERHQPGIALLYAVSSVTVGVLALWAGVKLIA